jgi:hypothetical protein
MFDDLAADALGRLSSGQAARRSTLQADGVPFEWSVSIGASPGGLRFVADPGEGVPSLLSQILRRLRVGEGQIERHREVLKQLREDGQEPETWVAGTVHPGGAVSLKVYVDQKGHPPAVRNYQLARCLVRLRRASALARLEGLLRAHGELVRVLMTAVEIGEDGVERVKVYTRPREGTLAAIARVAEAAGCGRAVDRVEQLADVLGRRAGFDARGVQLALDFPRDESEPVFKIYLSCPRVFASDAAADACVVELSRRFGFDRGEYGALVRTCAPRLSADRLDRFTWLGVAAKGDATRLNVYLHPGRP